MTGNRFRIVVIAALVATVAVASTGCKRMEERFTPPPKVVTREATVAVPAASVTGTVVAGLPESVPLWPAAQVVEAAKGKGTYDITLRTTDEYDPVLAGLVTGFEEAGWTVAQTDMSEAGVRNTGLEVAGDKVSGMVTVFDSEEVTGTVEIAYVLVTK